MVKPSSSFLSSLTVVLLLAGAARAADAPANKTAALEPNAVTGTVVAADGSPIVDAKVIIYGSGTRWAMSDAKGHFRIVHVFPDPRPRYIFAYRDRDNLVAPQMEVPESAGPGPNDKTYVPVLLPMSKGKQAKFILTSSKTGKPVVGAMIRFQYPDFRRVTSDKDGVGLASGLFAENYGVDIFGEGFTRSQSAVDLTSSASVGTCRAALEPGGAVRGVVVDGTGKPLADVNIAFDAETCADNWSPDGHTTDQDGKFQERFVTLDRTLDISFAHGKFKSKSLNGTDAAPLTSEKPTREVRVVLERRQIGGSATGTVTDRFGRPIPEADIRCTMNYPVNRMGYQRANSAETDAKGRFRLDDLTAGIANGRPIALRVVNGRRAAVAPPAGSDALLDHVTVAVSASGYAPKTVDLKVGPADHPADTTIALDPGHTVLGRVVDDRGKPVAGAEIAAFANGTAEGAVARDDGVFTLDSLPDDSRGQISTPYGEIVRGVELQFDTTHIVDYKVAAPGIIAARVVDAETGKPVQKFHVRLDNSSERQPGDRMVRFNIEKWWTPGTDVNATDGRFKIEPLAVGCPVEMVIDAPGYERDVNPRAVARSLDQSAESKIELLPIRAQDYCTLDFRLLDYRGKPIRDAQLRLVVSTREVSARDGLSLRRRIANGSGNLDQLGQFSWVDQCQTAATDADGRHRFTGIVPGRFVQVGYSGDGVPQDIWTSSDKLPNGKKLDVAIHVPQASGIHGTIDRKALPDAYWVLIRRVPFDGKQEQAQLNAGQSTFDFSDLVPGEYSVMVYSLQKHTQNGQTYYTNSSSGDEQISIKPGENKELHFPKK